MQIFWGEHDLGLTPRQTDLKVKKSLIDDMIYMEWIMEIPNCSGELVTARFPVHHFIRCLVRLCPTCNKKCFTISLSRWLHATTPPKRQLHWFSSWLKVDMTQWKSWFRTLWQRWPTFMQKEEKISRVWCFSCWIRRSCFSSKVDTVSTRIVMWDCRTSFTRP